MTFKTKEEMFELFTDKIENYPLEGEYGWIEACYEIVYEMLDADEDLLELKDMLYEPTWWEVYEALTHRYIEYAYEWLEMLDNPDY